MNRPTQSQPFLVRRWYDACSGTDDLSDVVAGAEVAEVGVEGSARRHRVPDRVRGTDEWCTRTDTVREREGYRREQSNRPESDGMSSIPRFMRAAARSTRRFARREEGATLIEYAILVLMVAVLCLLAVKVTGSKISDAYRQANERLP